MKPDTDWRSLPLAALFDADFAAWIKSLSRKARVGEPAMEWQDLGPFAHTAYQLHHDTADRYSYTRGKGARIDVLPEDATPEGFYEAAAKCRHQQVGTHNPLVVTPWDRLGAFSQFLYRRMADRIAQCAGFKGSAQSPLVDDGLGGDLDDGLGGDGLDAADDGLSDDDGLGGDFDDGLGSQVELFDELGDGL